MTEGNTPNRDPEKSTARGIHLAWGGRFTIEPMEGMKGDE